MDLPIQAINFLKPAASLVNWAAFSPGSWKASRCLDIHSYGISHLFFSCACNASLAAHVSIDDEKRRWRPNSQTALKGQRGHGPTTATLGSSRAPRVAPFKHTSEGILPSARAGSPRSQACSMQARASCPRSRGSCSIQAIIRLRSRKSARRDRDRRASPQAGARPRGRSTAGFEAFRPARPPR